MEKIIFLIYLQLKACILDDEALAIASLRVDLEWHFPDVIILETFQSLTKAKEFNRKQDICK